MMMETELYIRTRDSGSVRRLVLEPYQGALRSDSEFEAYDEPDGSSGRWLMFEAMGEYTTARSIAYVDDTLDDQQYFVQTIYETSGGTTPVSGNASYFGDYASFLSSANFEGVSNNNTSSYMIGDVSLFTDFNDNTIKGGITDRSLFVTITPNASGRAYSDVILFETSFDGSQSRTDGGTTEGGANEVVPPYGHWDIAFGGNEAVEAVGTIFIPHSPYLIENGTFFVNKNE